MSGEGGERRRRRGGGEAEELIWNQEDEGRIHLFLRGQYAEVT